MKKVNLFLNKVQNYSKEQFQIFLIIELNGIKEEFPRSEKIKTELLKYGLKMLILKSKIENR